MKRITGRLATKNQKWYAVLNLYDTEGIRKQRWVNLDLEDKRGMKTEANHRLAEILAQYNTGDLYLQEAMTHADRERNRIANMLVEDYLREWLEQHKPNISSSTYLNYKRMINGRMTAFFKPMRLKVKEITGDEINAYYTKIRADGLKGTTAQRHTPCCTGLSNRPLSGASFLQTHASKRIVPNQCLLSETITTPRS